MKSYVKPAIEVISMRTSENIADNIIKTIYTKNTSEGTFFDTVSDGYYSDALDITGSQNVSNVG